MKLVSFTLATALLAVAASRAHPANTTAPSHAIHLEAPASGTRKTPLLSPLLGDGDPSDDDQLPPPIDDAGWNKYTCKGAQFLAAMVVDDAQAARILGGPDAKTFQSEFQYYDLKTWGYVVTSTYPVEREYNGPHYGVGRALRELGLSDKSDEDGGLIDVTEVRHGDPELKYPDGRTVPSRLQIYDAGDGMIRHRTGGYFFVGVNPEEGVLLAMNRLGPAHAAKKWTNLPFPMNELPHLRQSSDIFWGMWEAYILRDRDNRVHLVDNVKYYFSMSITNHETLRIISRVLDNVGLPLEPWPGVKIDMNTENGKALLGSPNAVALAYFLIQHKDEGLGNRVVTGVSLFHGDTDHKAPCFVFYIDAAPPASRTFSSPPPGMGKALSPDVERRSEGRNILRRRVIKTRL
ncbi:hypothetical protein BS50DRAFT_185402 [Corynespora cassiicola Philippines]|uniref:Uncharacterized protein n=1 Tax=Corynespora cassiicola Philippines TaxID=1448308 RepID=A0A2T2P6M0_CORCC|nr:hypothetical protein BS50DRAFT_185402 [Corynespora cassiicola Philippines]